MRCEQYYEGWETHEIIKDMREQCEADSGYASLEVTEVDPADVILYSEKGENGDIVGRWELPLDVVHGRLLHVVDVWR